MANSGEILEFLSTCLEFIFSWVVLSAVCVIVAGKLLSRSFKLRRAGKQLFCVIVPKILRVSAKDDEVIIGFAVYVITFLMVGALFGQDAHNFFSDNFGLTITHWNSLAILSSMILVTWAVFVHLAHGFIESRRDRRIDEHNQVIQRLGEERGGMEDPR